MTLADMLDAGRYKRVRLIVRHGLGDAIMFAGVVLRGLRAQYPGIDFSLDTHLGQPEIFGTSDGDYDLEYTFSMPCAEWSAGPETKAELCAKTEAGCCVPGNEDYTLPVNIKNPLIAVHWTSTSCAGLCIPDEHRKNIWQMIIDAGLVPVDTNMPHCLSARRTPDWATRRMDDLPLSASTLAGVIGHCAGFAGCVSGNFWLALATLPPEKILLITTQFPAKKLTRLPVRELDLRRGFRHDIVNDWIAEVKK